MAKRLIGIEERKLLRDVNLKLQRQREKESRQRTEQSRRTGIGLGRSVREAGRSLQRPEDFSFHEQALREMFGRGEHIWGTNMQPVIINNDLNPRRSGREEDNETAEIFGFG